MKWTKEQEQAIYEKDSNILVAAAAGSGKTAVLVERIIHKIIDEKIDIDKILVVTFTNAAASEMRERILDAIYKKLEEEPENTNLQRQLTLLNKASICTIHSFCLDIIRNHFYETELSANFRIGNPEEIELLKNDVIEELFEQKYMDNSQGFIKLIETYTDYRGDEKLQEIILNLYKYIQSSPFPEKWLQENVDLFKVETNQDFGKTKWGEIILEDTKNIIKEAILKLTSISKKTERFPELEKYTLTLKLDCEQLQKIYESMEIWDEAYEALQNIKWTKWPVAPKVTIDLKNEAKEIRNQVKKEISLHNVIYTSKEANEDMLKMYEILKELQEIILEFSEQFSAKKREKNIIDFNDIEHFALKILLEEKEGKIVETQVAKEQQKKFEEIAIDEYQDSNLVQEYILNSISKKNNLFMVGDVKQSIYKFRQARPELFLEKYATYLLKENKSSDNQDLKIQLFKNFRSRSKILELTNIIFQNIMSAKLGDVEYTNEEYLNCGASYPEEGETKAELHIINLKEAESQIIEEEEETERVENAVLEARFVAQKVKEILDSDMKIFDKKQGFRKVTYKDICILLRATSVMAPIYEKELIDLEIPVFSDTSAEYLDSMEVQTIINLLKIIDNPMQDIPLVSVLRANIGGFTDNDLIEIRLASRNSSFYEAMLKSRLVVEEELKQKIENILNSLEKWKRQEEYLSLDELIWQIYIDTGFYHYVSLLTNGALRQANLKLLFEKAKQFEKASFKGLFNFINFLDKVKISSGDLGAAKLIGENENVTRIMSIHKSKGLEFPVVFLCGTGKRFNMQDLNSPIILHQDLGFGPKLIDIENKIEYNTLAKEAVKLVTKKETISEEMRILYVALTRAKEKLIITGISKDLHKSLQEKEQLIEVYQASKKEKIHNRLVEKYISYLDWLELIYIYNKEEIKTVLEVQEHNKEDILRNNQIIEEKSKNTWKEQIEEYKDKKQEGKSVNKILKWQYRYQEASKIPTKTSVTKLKQLKEEATIDLEETIKIKEKIEKQRSDAQILTAKPHFLEKEQILTPMQKGTVMHLCVQKLNEKQAYTIEDLKEFVEELYMKKVITQLEKESINIKVLEKYTKSELWKELNEAKEIYKEQPFYINIPAKQIYQNAEENEKILVQGIIDLYYINKNGELILVDYKTDYIKPGEENKLEEKYKIQLEIYKTALESSLGKKVNKAMIYSLS